MRLGTGPQVPADGLCLEAEGELLAYLAVVVGDDVAEVPVDSAQASDLHVDASLLVDLAACGRDYGLAEVLGAAGIYSRVAPGP